MPQATLSPATIVARNSGFMEAEVDQEIVALDVEKGVYYGLNPVGSRIWRLLINPIRIADICTAWPPPLEPAFPKNIKFS